MSFDQNTRNRLQKFVSDTRAILIEEFTRQLQSTYGMDPHNGGVAEIETLTNLDNNQRETAAILRDTLAHYVSSISAKSEKERTKQALDRIIREQAFTILNRLAALRMAEAREFLIESISKGFGSKGFQLYKNLSGTGLGETGEVYRCYLYSIFDEFTLDLAILFDRHSAKGRLFPRESALLNLLEQMNHFEIEHLWEQDETIGWIYQYFNSQEERRKMRAESQAPRNSRELAVRNQFFTPRYVVEFLTDNTLGRIWYEMTKGKTLLVDCCRYLVRRPNEIFLTKGEAFPEVEEGQNENLSQEELLNKMVYIPFRQLKDPREILMLDPACGSMHFGLYAFDLFEKIYEEAWQLESELGADAFSCSAKFQPLHSSYANFEDFQKAIPKLIIENNIHGVDIDPRAVQIAGLSLWQRAQRSWQLMHLNTDQRPSINKSNIVCAEPMPGETELLKEFSTSLKPRVLGQLLEIIFDKMNLAGEAGSLLKIEQEIVYAIEHARSEFEKDLKKRDANDQLTLIPEWQPDEQHSIFDFTDLPDETEFWETAEQQILDALKEYAESAETVNSARRLFAEDAARGFSFIDLCRKKYDVVLMNPPFGTYTKRIEPLIKTNYSTAKADLYACFIDRGIDFSKPLDGSVGAITARTGFFLNRLKEWRFSLLEKGMIPYCFADLGGGVLDAAMVETAAYVLSAKSYTRTVFITCTEESSRESLLKNACAVGDKEIPNCYEKDFKLLDKIPEGTWAYWAPDKILNLFVSGTAYEHNYGEVYVGVQTDDDYRFVRLNWEVSRQDTSKSNKDLAEEKIWVPFLKGGDSSPFYSDVPCLLNWDKNGKELKAFVTKVLDGGHWSRHIFNSDVYFKPGISWALRTDFFSPHVVPEGCIPSVSRYLCISEKMDTLECLGLFNSIFYDYLIKLRMEKWSQPKFIVGAVKDLPITGCNSANDEVLPTLVNEGFKILQKVDSYFSETSNIFVGMFIINQEQSIHAMSNSMKTILLQSKSKIINIGNKIDDHVSKCLSVPLKELNAPEGIISWDLKWQRLIGLNLADEKNISNLLFSLVFGAIFGRWDIRHSGSELHQLNLPEPFSPLPSCPPGSLQNDKKRIQEQFDISKDYPLCIVWSGILVDEESHSEDIINRFEDALKFIWKDKWDSVAQEACNILGITSIREYFNRPSAFFSDHLKRYSKSRRQAPIYWPLQTPSGSYTLWIYYHRLSGQTLYTCVNDFVEPKLKNVTVELNILLNKSSRTGAEEKELTSLSDLVAELKDFRDELLRIAKFWNPNLNDGVQINAAPFWKLFQHKQWQKKLKEIWGKLENGEYDWAHLANNIWPERVLRKCHKDRSLAIAHDVESDLWVEEEVAIVRRGKDSGDTKTEWRPKKLSETELKELIQRKIAEIKR
jgi:hypothetical protein